MTDHVTELLLLPVTVAEKSKDAPARRFAVVGLIVTEILRVGGGTVGGTVLLEPEPVLPHEERVRAEAKNSEIERARRMEIIFEEG